VASSVVACTTEHAAAGFLTFPAMLPLTRTRLAIVSVSRTQPTDTRRMGPDGGDIFCLAGFQKPGSQVDARAMDEREWVIAQTVAQGRDDYKRQCLDFLKSEFRFT
jgi:hypothetical protein